jgi:hypothetical protein
MLQRRVPTSSLRPTRARWGVGVGICQGRGPEPPGRLAQLRPKVYYPGLDPVTTVGEGSLAMSPPKMCLPVLLPRSFYLSPSDLSGLLTGLNQWSRSQPRTCISKSHHLTGSGSEGSHLLSLLPAYMVESGNESLPTSTRLLAHKCPPWSSTQSQCSVLLDAPCTDLPQAVVF